MIPAAFGRTLPFSSNLDPFEIYFILNKNDYRKNRGWINRLNNDNSITAGLFKIKVYLKELIYDSPEGELINGLLKHTNVIARVLHLDPEMVHVEHIKIYLGNKDDERFKQDLRLFILQVCRANIDEIRQILYFPRRKQMEFYNHIFDNQELLKDTESTLERLIDFYSSKIEENDKIRLRRYRYPKEEPLRSKRIPTSNYNTFNPGFLSFQVPSFLSDYDVKEDKIKELTSVNYEEDENGNIKFDPESIKLLLIKGGIIVPRAESNPLMVSPDKIYLKVLEGKEKKSERLPVLEIYIGNNCHKIALKSIEGSIFYIGALLKRKFNQKLKREEITNLFKSIPKNPDIKRLNIAKFIPENNIPVYLWLKEIYSKLIIEESFDNWFYKLYTKGWDNPTKQGVTNIKKNIKDSMYGAGFENYTPLINLKSIKERNSKSEKLSRTVQYTVEVNPDKIIFPDSFSDLISTTEKFISNLLAKQPSE